MADRMRTPRRRKEWSAIPEAELALTADGTFIGGGAAFVGGGNTILRVRGELLFSLTPGGTFAAGDNAKVAVGLGIFSTDAFTLGATAMPDPGAEVGYPWLWWGSFGFRAYSNSAESTNSANVGARIPVDTKSMRKISVNQTLGWVFQYEDISGAPPISINQGPMRMLVALP